jgi:NodT family efflux transporter outer membrane factor (OMF) lipoprotein
VRARGAFTLPFDFSYEVDLWGRIRRTVTPAGEEAQATAADLETATLSLHAELAVDYFELRSADAQQRLLNATVDQYADMVKLTTALLDGGAALLSDVIQAKTQLDTARVQDTDIGVMRAQFEHAIAILIGKPPAEFTLAPSPLNLDPPVIPFGVPSQLLERRPDIAASERRVGEANEGIGIARAAYFPRLVLSATGGLEGTSIANWFAWPSRFWAVGPTMLETIFDGGRRRATSEGALANYDATVANYRQTTLVAFQEVEDNLAAPRILEHEARQQREATAEALRGVEIFTNRYQGGADPYLQVITAETIALANERNEIDILRRRMDASVLLIKRLGGGWDVSKLPQVSSMRGLCLRGLDTRLSRHAASWQVDATIAQTDNDIAQSNEVRGFLSDKRDKAVNHDNLLSIVARELCDQRVMGFSYLRERTKLRLPSLKQTDSPAMNPQEQDR